MSEEKIEVELSVELIKAIDANRGSLTMAEFIEMGMRASMNPKLKPNREELLRKW